MEINYYHINLYVALFDELQYLALLPEYLNICINIENDHKTSILFNSKDIISDSKLKRLLFKKYKYVKKPVRYTAEAFELLEHLLKNDIANKYLLWSDEINYLNNNLIVDQYEKNKLGRLFYISFEVEQSENLNKVILTHFTTMLKDLKCNNLDEVKQIKESYLSETDNININIIDYNKSIRKIKRLQKKIKRST